MTDKQPEISAEGLVGRLREGGLKWSISYTQLCQEAAVEITRLNAECERWINAYKIAFEQATANGERAARLSAKLEERTPPPSDEARKAIAAIIEPHLDEGGTGADADYYAEQAALDLADEILAALNQPEQET